MFRLSLELERVLMNVARKGEPKLRFDRLPVPFAMDYHKVSASHHVFHYESQLDFPAEAILSLFREFDLVAQWNRMCLETRILDEESDAHLLAFFRLWMPFPFAEREFVFECWGADLLDEAQAFVVLIGDGPRDATGLAGYPASSGKARPRINFLEDSAAVLFPKLAADGRSQTLVKTTLHVDLHIATPPQWLLEVVFKVIAPCEFLRLGVPSDTTTDAGRKTCTRSCSASCTRTSIPGPARAPAPPPTPSVWGRGRSTAAARPAGGCSRGRCSTRTSLRTRRPLRRGWPRARSRSPGSSPRREQTEEKSRT